ncbi:hypothetical protein [Rhizobium wuzhouense]|uniref:Uncharacterized protein n=1 Tax=Rhizobium wuzhouense TaxID=1986026 RepID=A0ABX5NLR5_9HYPH|nr:hypothetical protein [Rhizobium wuzhouense]PYB69683.1 hypothetical protein DMY87_23390 [Rhizobium wuzhouense]
MNGFTPDTGAAAAGEHGDDRRGQPVDAQTRDMAQEAGLDRDLESQVPPLYGSFTQRVVIALLVVAVAALIWILA